MSMGSLTLGPYGFSYIDQTTWTSNVSAIKLQVNTTSITSPDMGANGGTAISTSSDLVCVAGDVAFSSNNRYLNIQMQRSDAYTAFGRFKTRSHYTTSSWGGNNNASVSSANYYNCGNIGATTSKSGERLQFHIWISYNANHNSGRPWGDVTLWYQNANNNPYLSASYGCFQNFNIDRSTHIRLYPNSGSFSAGRVKIWHFGAS